MSAPKCQRTHDVVGKEDTTTYERLITDLPPEVLENILGHALGGARKRSELSHRLVCTQWRDVINEIVSRRIASGALKPMPELKAGGRPCDKLKLHNSVTPFSDIYFPFNSLLLNGKLVTKKEPGIRDVPMAFSNPKFSFGSNLTSFCLVNKTISLKSLRNALGSMPFLKHLGLFEVQLIDGFSKLNEAASLTPPTLPNLTTLELNTGLIQSERLKAKAKALILWLIVSYADQIIRLNISSEGRLPPLQRRQQYSVSVGNSHHVIGTTSDLAFGNLKDLQIENPSPEFLNHSHTPVLRSLSLKDFNSGNLQLVTQFIYKYRSTLEEVYLDTHWDVLMNMDLWFSIRQNQTQLTPSRNTISKLKVLKIPFPKEFLDESILFRDLLVLFPNLEELHFVHFGHEHSSIIISEMDDQQDEDETMGNNNENNQAENIAALKEGLISLREQLSLQRRLKVASLREYDRLLRVDLVLGDLEAIGFHWIESVETLTSELASVKRGVVALRKRFTDLGGNMVQLEVEQILKMYRVWNTTKLKIASVSSSGKPDGNVCTIPKTEC